MKETPEQFMEAYRFAGQSIPLCRIPERKIMLKAEIEPALEESKRRNETLQSRVAELEAIRDDDHKQIVSLQGDCDCYREALERITRHVEKTAGGMAHISGTYIIATKALAR